MPSSTPKLDALKAWLDSDRSGPLVWPVELKPVTPADILRAAASGAPASLPPRSVVIAGKRIPPPPRRKTKASTP